MATTTGEHEFPPRVLASCAQTQPRGSCATLSGTKPTVPNAMRFNPDPPTKTAAYARGVVDAEPPGSRVQSARARSVRSTKPSWTKPTGRDPSI